MTRVDIQARLNNFFANNVYYTGQDFNDSIQDGLDEICAFTGCVMQSYVLPFVTNLTYYNMINLLPNYLALFAMYNGTINRWMWPTSLKKLDQVRVDWETAPGTPWYFVPVSHRYVAIYKKPNSPAYGNMHCFYFATAPLLGDSTTIPIPDDHIQALESYSILDMWEQNQEWDKSQTYFNTYVQNIEMLRVYMRNRRNTGRGASLR